MSSTKRADPDLIERVLPGPTSPRSWLGAIPFRARLALVSAGAVAVAVAAAAAAIYVVVERQLVGGVDSALRLEATRVADSPYLVTPAPGFEPNEFFVHVPRPALGGAGGYIQLVSRDGRVFRSGDEPVALPVLPETERLADGQGHSFFTSAMVGGVHVRVFATRVAQGLALQVAQPLTQPDHEVATIRLWLILIAAGGIGVATGLGLLVTQSALAPVRRLTETAEHVAATADLRSRISVSGRDELARLAGSFNVMLQALEQSADAQRLLIADASHELRTPLTSLRTNVEVLRLRFPPKSDDDARLLADVVEQIDEMSSVIVNLVALARGDEQSPRMEEVDLRGLVEEAVERARLHYRGVEFKTDLEQSIIVGDRMGLQRAVQNLLDNAGKWSPAGAPVEVSLGRGELAVRDRGPGIAASDLPHIFERFYRAPEARGLPGSGLGLAIVKQAVEAHGGVVTVLPAQGGGTCVRVSLPLAHSEFYLHGSHQVLRLPRRRDSVDET